MKNLSLQEILVLKSQIQPGTSLPIDGNRTIKTVTHYFTGFLSDLKLGQLAVPGNKEVVGQRSIEGNTLPTGTTLYVTDLKASFDITAVQANGIELAEFGKSFAPINFNNGEVRISQGVELFRSSGSDVTNRKASTGNDDDFRSITPFAFRPGKTFDIIFDLASAAAANQAFKLEMRCIEVAELDLAK